MKHHKTAWPPSVGHIDHQRATWSVTRGVLKKAIGKPCEYCREPMALTPHKKTPTRDHVLPAGMGFRLTDFDGRNRALVCAGCNMNKGGLHIFAWLVRLQKGGDPRAVHVAAFIARSGLTTDMLHNPSTDVLARRLARGKAALEHANECSALWAAVENLKPESP